METKKKGTSRMRKKTRMGRSWMKRMKGGKKPWDKDRTTRYGSLGKGPGWRGEGKIYFYKTPCPLAHTATLQTLPSSTSNANSHSKLTRQQQRPATMIATRRA